MISNVIHRLFLRAGMRALLAGALMIAPVARLAAQAPVDPDVARRTQWFHEAKFGMLITWGLYSIPAGEWKGQEIRGIGEWIQNRAHIPLAEYALLAPQFNPVKFNADEWATVAKQAGMRYMVPMPKHHDGFCLFGTKVDTYNIVDGTPFHRDPMKELSEACRKQGLRMGFYYSQAQDWHHPGGAVIGGQWDPAQQGDFDDYLNKVSLPQVRELLTNYGPIALLWFDTPLNMTPPRAQRFVDLVREVQPGCLINGRLGIKQGTDYSSMGDNAVPDHVLEGAWETPATINDTWGFKKMDHNWKPADTLIFRLVDIVSKGGNYLLNVGPTAEGVIPPESVKVLQQMGAWLQVNGEAIYGTGPTPFGAELKSSAIHDAHFQYQKPTGWRCTTKPGKIYIHLFDWPQGSFRLEDVKGKVTGARLLAAPQHKLKFKQMGAAVVVSLPSIAPGEFANVLALDVKTEGR
jgi:alpha-L-fucosidase